MTLRLSKNAFFLLLLLLLAFWAFGPFFISGLPNTHDGQTHVMRLASFHQALIDGQIPPRWAGNLAHGFGSPVLSFAFPLPYLLGEFFYRFGFSFVDSTKIVFTLSFLFSAITMFLFLSRFTNGLSAFVGALIYLFAPYRFLDLYVRGDVGESLVFVFPPLILWLLWETKTKFDWSKIVLASFSIAAMFLSHQIMAGVFMVIIFLLLLLKGSAISLLISTALGVLLASFNLLPLVFEKGLTNLNYLALTNFQNQFPTIQSLLYSKWHWGPASPSTPEISMAFQLGLAQWLTVGLLVLFLIWQRKRFKEENYRLAGLVFGLFVFFLFLITKYSEFLWQNISPLAMVLYPWRFLGAAVFLVAVMSALLIYLVKHSLIKILLVIVLLVLAWYGNRNHNQVVGRTIHDDAFYLTYLGTSDMWGEFLPKGAQPPEKETPAKAEVTGGKAQIQDLKIKSNEVSFKAKVETESSVRVNNFSYPGWKVLVDNQSIKLRQSQLLEFILPVGVHQVRVKFTETPLRLFANVLSLLTFIFLLWSVILKSLNKQ